MKINKLAMIIGISIGIMMTQLAVAAPPAPPEFSSEFYTALFEKYKVTQAEFELAYRRELLPVDLGDGIPGPRSAETRQTVRQIEELGSKAKSNPISAAENLKLESLLERVIRSAVRTNEVRAKPRIEPQQSLEGRSGERSSETNNVTLTVTPEVAAVLARIMADDPQLAKDLILMLLAQQMGLGSRSPAILGSIRDSSVASLPHSLSRPLPPPYSSVSSRSSKPPKPKGFLNALKRFAKIGVQDPTNEQDEGPGHVASGEAH